MIETGQIFTQAKVEMENERGFTLIEVLVAVAISAILTYSIFSVFKTGSSEAQVMDNRMYMQDNARAGLNKMIQEIRESAPSKIAWTSNTLTFQTPSSVNSSGQINWSGAIRYSVGGASNRQLIRTAPDGTTTVMSNDVQSATFTGNSASNPTLITVQLNLQRSTIDGRSYTSTLAAQAEVRNA